MKFEERVKTDGEQEMEERNHTTTHTESTYLPSLQFSFLLWKGRPPTSIIKN